VLQLQVLSGKMAGVTSVARRFPFTVGRSGSAHMRIEDDGVWDNHLTFSLRRDRTIELTAQPGALVTVNGQSVPTAVVRNGDIIEMGAARLVFGLSPTRQKGTSLRETLVWLGLILIGLIEVGLIYYLLE
jgi:hypothetical protein